MKITFTKEECMRLIKERIIQIFPDYDVKGDEINNYGDSIFELIKQNKGDIKNE